MVTKTTVWSLSAQCAVLTAIFSWVLYAICRPESCSASDACKAYHQNTGVGTSPLIVGGLAAAFVYQTVSLALNFDSAKPLFDVVDGMKSGLVPGVLLSVCFASLLFESLFLGYVGLAHAAVSGVGFRSAQPVYTVICIEWLITVPALLMLAGKCGLGRPIQELVRPVIVTNLYIVTAWSAHFVSHPVLRWVAVGVALLAYAFASYDMVRWTADFHRVAKKGLVCRQLRPVLVIGLIVLFGIYGIWFLQGFVGVVTAERQRDVYVVMNIGGKAVFAMAFFALRANQYHELITDLIVNSDLPFDRLNNEASYDDEPVEDSDKFK